MDQFCDAEHRLSLSKPDTCRGALEMFESIEEEPEEVLQREWAHIARLCNGNLYEQCRENYDELVGFIEEWRHYISIFTLMDLKMKLNMVEHRLKLVFSDFKLQKYEFKEEKFKPLGKRRFKGQRSGPDSGRHRDPKGYYATLEISQSADTDDISQAYRTLARKYHPDKNRDDPDLAQERFLAVKEAYEALKDPVKRQLYDVEAQLFPGDVNAETTKTKARRSSDPKPKDPPPQKGRAGTPPPKQKPGGRKPTPLPDPAPAPSKTASAVAVRTNDSWSSAATQRQKDAKAMAEAGFHRQDQDDKKMRIQFRQTYGVTIEEAQEQMKSMEDTWPGKDDKPKPKRKPAPPSGFCIGFGLWRYCL